MWRKSKLALFVALALPGGASELQRFEAAEPHMGTQFRITAYAQDGERAHAAFREAFVRIAQLDDELSDYKPDSELMRVCREPFGTPVAVSADLFTVLERAQQISRETDGAFDVTLGPVIRLWREARRTGILPDADVLSSARKKTGYQNLVLDSARKTVTLSTPGMRLDLGAIAKGYAADEALRLLRARGLGSALIAASGDLAIGDAPPGKAGWRVAIESPGNYSEVMTMHNTAVSTSGDTEQFVEFGGVRYSHIVDPKTGRGLTHGVAASVIAHRGMDADSYATALCVLAGQHGASFARHWAQRAGVQARVVYESTVTTICPSALTRTGYVRSPQSPDSASPVDISNFHECSGHITIDPPIKPSASGPPL